MHVNARQRLDRVECMGRPPLINRTQVAEAALRIIDDEGLEALSIERIGQEVGVRGPTLYHHFNDKADILAEAARLVLGDLDFDRQADDWQEWMIGISLTFYRRLLEHPNATVILIESLPDASALPGLDRAARLLDDAGIERHLHVLIMEGTEKIVWGWALQRAMMVQQGARMSRANLRKRWPVLAAAAAASDMTDEEMLEASIRAFHAGVLAGAADRPIVG
jgi:TetR/AcrR family transcriptional regulator, tetracycline repressor protein